MKKLMFMLLGALGTVSAQSADYPYLTFELTDGTRASVEVAALRLSVNGTTLTAGSRTFELTNLDKMYFSATDETATGISNVTSADVDEIVEVCDLNGRVVAKEQMKHGIYVVKTKKGTYKLRVE